MAVCLLESVGLAVERRATTELRQVRSVSVGMLAYLLTLRYFDKCIASLLRSSKVNTTGSSGKPFQNADALKLGPIRLVSKGQRELFFALPFQI